MAGEADLSFTNQPQKLAVKTAINTPAWLSELEGMLGTYGGNRAILYKTVPIVFQAINLRCNALSGVPVVISKLTNRKDDAGNPVEEETTWDFGPLSKLLFYTEASLLMTGKAFWEIGRNTYGFTKQVVYHNPYTIRVEYDRKRLLFTQTADISNRREMVWTNDLERGLYEMVFFTDYDPTNDLTDGVGALEVAAGNAELLRALTMFPQKYFEGGAMPATLLAVDTQDENELSRVKSFFESTLAGIRRAFRVFAYRAGSFKVETLTPDLDKLVLPALQDEARKNIAIAFGVPESMLDTTASNFATAKEARLSFYEDTIMPRARIIEETVNEQLLKKEGKKLRFAFERMSIFQEDEADRASVFAAYQAGGMPIIVAAELAGVRLTEEQRERIEAAEAFDDALDSIEYGTPAGTVEDQPAEKSAFIDDIEKWERKAAKRLARGQSALVDFESDNISSVLRESIQGALEEIKDAEDIKRLFRSVREWEDYP